MQSIVLLKLGVSQSQERRLADLQALFALACNALAPVVSSSRCWNRVALHHLAYKGLREQFPQLGSQMVCNVIYSVCRAARLVYQHPQSPWCVGKRAVATLPVIAFSNQVPVFFDRHTLSIKSGQASMFTLDGRLRFQLGLGEAEEARFRQEKIKEISLEQLSGSFYLRFVFSKSLEQPSAVQARELDLPSYLVVHNAPAQAAAMSQQEDLNISVKAA
jgi:hypothetical protein